MYETQNRFQNKVAGVIKLAADYIHKKASKLIVFDAGCGAGILLRHLDLDLVDKYAGADIAHAAPGEIAPKRCQDKYVFSPLSG
jgi:2-polyprenyl-3-methyl-5-hydroxy-6-metoxy-1,4-benzoquinol methylase